MTGCIAVIMASGRGQRFGEALPKQYAPLAGRPL
ncbi:MAG: 2-C-methyl-D-erythritol 4-phosphate cytidylyltransferase, partial [Rhizobiales bacterium]|nr:2-C-methyl-D-erythritol 4-phosphate cytidylyltransferase [Hyphomicrobiales bacterium]